MKDLGYTEKVEATRERWRMTDHGLQCIRIARPLKCVAPVLKPRHDISDDEVTVFELLHQLYERGWRFCVFYKSKKCKRPAPFHEAKKIAWAKPDQLVWKPLYFRSLLKASIAKPDTPAEPPGDPPARIELEHFRSPAYYRCFLDDVPFGSRPKKQRKLVAFQFSAEGATELHDSSDSSSSSSSRTSKSSAASAASTSSSSQMRQRSASA